MKRALFCLLLAGCRDGTESACQELSRHAPGGIVLASEEQRCAALLEFANSTKANYDMEFGVWLNQVAPQRAEVVLDVIAALTDRGDWQPVSFGKTPESVSCGGSLVTDGLWTAPLSSVLETRPKKLYVSVAVTIDSGNVATIRVFQDFDCDGKNGVTEVVGRFQPGTSAFTGGWQRLSTKTAELDE